MQFIDFVKLNDLVEFHLWYLDDGTFIGSPSSLLQLLNLYASHGPQFGLHLNLSKCELFWPSGDPFPEVPTNINHVNKGLELLGCPIWGTKDFFQSVSVFLFSQSCGCPRQNFHSRGPPG